MYYARPPRHPKIINFFRYYLLRTDFRNSPDPTSHTKPQQIIDDLHNLRLRYDRIGSGLKRLKTKRRYYKRVRDDAPFASELPIKIKERLDRLRKIGKPGKIINLMAYRAEKEQVELKMRVVD